MWISGKTVRVFTVSVLLVADGMHYATSSAQEDALATVKRPIQAWYSTETVTMNGGSWADSVRSGGQGTILKTYGQSEGGGVTTREITIPANVAHTSGAIYPFLAGTG